MRNYIVAAAFAVASLASAANAATVVFLPGVFGAPAGFTLVSDFNTPAAQSIVTGSDFFFPTGTTPGLTVAVPGNNTPYLSVVGGGVANITFSDVVRSFSFDYSTVDTYNTLTINYADSGFETLTGDDIITVGLANGTISGSFRIDGDGRQIAGLSLATTSNSFEVDNLATRSVVPEPSSWLMMIAGFGLVGFSARRRRTTAVVA